MIRKSKTMQLKKSEFSGQELFRLAKRLDDSITNVFIQELKGEEYVIIQRKNTAHHQKVLVTANSLGCIAIEVIKAIIY